VSFEGFSDERLAVNGVTLRVRARRHARGDARAVLLLHGFPQSHYLWRKVVARLALDYSVVCPDLRGYGDSDKPRGLADHSNYSKRAMAEDLALLMSALGHESFSVVGHDRGGRVAHRLALDHAKRIERVCLLDIAPTLTMYDQTDMAFAQAYFHWFFLIQAHPLPEMMMAGCAPALLRAFLGRWGADRSDSDETAIAEYQRCWANPEGLHASCEDYRASAGIDLEHDRESDARQQLIECPLLVLWGQNGVIQRLFQPLTDWRAKTRAPVEGRALAAGHYIPEEVPDDLLAHLLPFLAGALSGADGN
jgi:haloacetate dehalogenase